MAVKPPRGAGQKPRGLYMSDVLIQLALTRIGETLDGIGVFIQARYP
jgi:hypothetical protein